MESGLKVKPGNTCGQKYSTAFLLNLHYVALPINLQNGTKKEEGEKDLFTNLIVNNKWQKGKKTLN